MYELLLTYCNINKKLRNFVVCLFKRIFVVKYKRLNCRISSRITSIFGIRPDILPQCPTLLYCNNLDIWFFMKLPCKFQKPSVARFIIQDSNGCHGSKQVQDNQQTGPLLHTLIRLLFWDKKYFQIQFFSTLP